MVKPTHPAHQILLGLTRSEEVPRVFQHADTKRLSTMKLEEFGIVAREFHNCSLVVASLDKGEDGTKVSSLDKWLLIDRYNGKGLSRTQA